jgi:hypothetical protein
LLRRPILLNRFEKYLRENAHFSTSYWSVRNCCSCHQPYIGLAYDFL